MSERYFLKKLIHFLIPTLIPLMLLGSLTILVTKRYMTDEISKHNMLLLEQTRDRLDSIFDQLDVFTLNFDYNSEVSQTLNNSLNQNPLGYEDFFILQTTKNFLTSFTSAQPYLESIYVYYTSNDRHFYTTSEGFSSLDKHYDVAWYKSLMDHRNSDAEIWTEVRSIKPFSFQTNSTEVLSIYKKIHQPNGVIVLNIQTEYLKRYLHSLLTYPNQRIIVQNEKNDTMLTASSEDDHGSYLPWVSDTRVHTETITSNRYHWTYTSAVPNDVLFMIPNMLKLITIILALSSFVLSFCLTYYLTRKNYKQIRYINYIIHAAENNLELPDVREQTYDEYGYIVNNLIKSFIEHSYIKVQLSEKKYRLQAMELLALQSQINPHFLFNTLHTIYWEAYGLSGKPNRVTDILENLSDILEYCLSNPAEMITLEKEVQFTKSYIQIQKERYKEKFDVVWKVDRGIETFNTIKLIIQPLIENSIYHGIKVKEDSGSIKIKIMKRSEGLSFSVIDNGVGIPKENLTAIQQSLLSDEFSEQIGLYNVDHRLKLTYGDGAGLIIRSKPNWGTVIRFNVTLI